ncbi:MAG: hypothetical protein J6W56_00340 [Prevotella sp.]|nr:hypothetical protein [Prevotella sp.]
MNKDNLENQKNSNGTVVFNISKSGVSRKNVKKGQKNIFYIVLKRARKLYDDQLDKTSCNLYRDCIQKVIMKTEGITEVEFKTRFAEIVIDLMDRNSFNTECRSRKWSPYVVATHLAAMTIAQRKEVLNNMDLLPEKVISCGKPIYEMAELKDLDKYKVMSEETDTVTD